MAKVFWFTGLLGSGKTTIGRKLLKALPKSTLFLDGDIVRDGLCSDLGFSVKDRNENIRRMAEVSALGYNSGLFVICCFISPIVEQRRFARILIPPLDFVEVYLNTSLEVCEKRDVKGLYKKAREGIVKEFTGISSPYEAPTHPEVTLDTGTLPITECLDVLMTKIYDEEIQ